MNSLQRLNDVLPVEVKSQKDIERIDSLIIPGGESTTIGKLLRDFNLSGCLVDRIHSGMPVWGTCAGMILLARKIVEEDSIHLGVMDIEVRRNAYGSQLDSFSCSAVMDKVSEYPIELVFIRAPWIERAGENVEVLAVHECKIIAARQNNMLATSFHPELTDDLTFHKYFAGF
ncbi:pyridoxal 5'-phosphate synthase, glutaminase subunit Pdx2 [Pseudobacteroides cellulosolvens ATCC 35603 = DSM 2933]|uniref:Pyridoxal 5'-phosphate synthase, glutaminase subunit Pdx2 n=2 Tax=Pseudobacteroides cellulosolvens TaxID=35825 RepID=A0A0L6JN08_9FIRM|nr:pyridoxal 5'-phosphate synthase, glutaminase subunit Pdx2 [Pseudobacteroides cellulosolvens ATCC 35603 = DSM 2933]